MRVAVVGSGTVGNTLAGAAASAGHQVVFGTRRDPVPPADDRAITFGRVQDVVAAAEVVILAVPGAAAEQIAVENSDSLNGRIVIDATNNIGGAGPVSSVEAIRAAAPGAHVFRAFNSVGWENMTYTDPSATRPDMFYAGPDDESRPQVEALISDIGPRPVYVGDSAAALAAVDALTGLWFALAFGQGRGRRVAFKLIET